MAFKSDQKTQEFKKLSTKLVDQWDLGNQRYLFDHYYKIAKTDYQIQ